MVNIDSYYSTDQSNTVIKCLVLGDSDPRAVEYLDEHRQVDFVDDEENWPPAGVPSHRLNRCTQVSSSFSLVLQNRS